MIISLEKAFKGKMALKLHFKFLFFVIFGQVSSESNLVKV